MNGTAIIPPVQAPVPASPADPYLARMDQVIARLDALNYGLGLLITFLQNQPPARPRD